MTANQRFSSNEDRYIIDRLNPAKHVECYCGEGDPKDDMHLRERVLWIRLADLVEDLIINTNPTERLSDGREYQPDCEESRSISRALYNAITASHLNTFGVTLSIQYRYGGELTREKVGWQDFTSLSLFVDDVEHLLRDLYGEFDNRAISRVRDAVFWIVEEFTQYLRKDLWQEHQEASCVDYMCGIGVPEGCGINGSEYRGGLCAAHDLERRARAVRANPAAFSRYTVGFVDKLFANWRSLAEPTEEVPAVAPRTEELPF
jgi:hypothetical protein